MATGTPPETETRLTFEESRRRLERARKTTPGGVHSNIRLSEQPWPLFFDHADGSHLYDVDGNDLIDYVLANGPLLLGHTPRRVIAAVQRQLDRGLIYAGQTELEVEAAERIVELVPCAEQVRFNMTGTEAVQAALRIARAATGRQKVLIFQGHYDGWADSVIWNTGTLGAPLDDRGAGAEVSPVAESQGVETAVGSDLIVAQWNDADAVEAILARHRDELAAVLMEPIMGNSGVIEPRPGYLQTVRDLCTRFGVVLIFDEVITGFRVGPGGAQGRTGVTPDLCVMGKAVASGLPVAFVAGRADLFREIGTGRVLHAGTFNAWAPGMAAAVETLRILGDPSSGVYEHIERVGGGLRDGMQQIAAARGGGMLIQGLPAVFHVAFSPLAEAFEARDAARADYAEFRRFVRFLLERGVRIAGRGNVFLSAAHSDEDVDRTLDAFDRALAAFRAGAAA
jgi:glutamate-1-semialdehyde 2,1-aminomutase